VDKATMQKIIEALLKSSFDGGRHFTRLYKFL
jgi:ribose 5-phosphate isomerase RpiB